MARFGADDETISALRDADAEAFGIDPDCWDSFRLFLDLDTQWRQAEGIPVGLDYGAVPAVLRLQRLRPWPGLFEDLRVMERALLDALREQREREEWLRR